MSEPSDYKSLIYKPMEINHNEIHFIGPIQTKEGNIVQEAIKQKIPNGNSNFLKPTNSYGYDLQHSPVGQHIRNQQNDRINPLIEADNIRRRSLEILNSRPPSVNEHPPNRPDNINNSPSPNIYGPIPYS